MVFIAVVYLKGTDSVSGTVLSLHALALLDFGGSSARPGHWPK